MTAPSESHIHRSDATRVGVLWALVLVVFALFNAIYWPVHLRNTFNDPANFMPRAQRLHERGQLAGAIDLLKKGIAAAHPTSPAPYELLQAWHREFNDEAGAKALDPSIAYYQSLRAPLSERPGRLAEAVNLFRDRNRTPQLSPEATRAIRAAAGGLSVALGVGDYAITLPPTQQFALLALAGGKTSITGKIGSTETKIPFDLVVQSGGGDQDCRMAHIFLHNRDYGGAERGMHVALIDPVTGEPTQLGVFDIWAAPENADRMARMLNAAPNGTVGAFAVYDDASANMTDALEDALRSFGFLPETILQRRPRFYGLRYSYAAIGVKGAIPGQAMQAWSPDEFDGRPGHPVACMVLGASLDAEVTHP